MVEHEGSKELFSDLVDHVCHVLTMAEQKIKTALGWERHVRELQPKSLEISIFYIRLGLKLVST